VNRHTVDVFLRNAEGNRLCCSGSESAPDVGHYRHVPWRRITGTDRSVARGLSECLTIRSNRWPRFPKATTGIDCDGRLATNRETLGGRHRYRSQLPGRRVELFAEICDVFLGRRQQAKGLELDLTPAQKVRALRVLAFDMMCREVRD
jgi:hypothetical protein